MKYFSEILKIIDGGLKSDIKKVEDYSVLLAGKLSRDGEIIKSERISKILLKNNCITNNDLIQMSSMNDNNIKQIPYDNESKLELADVIYPKQVEDKKIFLSNEIKSQIDEFVLSYQNSDKLASYDLDIAATILLYGPPGCGKTVTALNIAKKLNLPIVIARLDTLISSFLGSTAKNIRLLFDFASKIPCVLFLDEFDALAKQRDDIHEMGELKRVVNSLLQNIDNLNNKSVLIAATNHSSLLDGAIWRRFNTRLNIELPDYELVNHYIDYLISEAGHTLDVKVLDFISKLLEGQSLADIEQIVKRSLRKAVLGDRNVGAANFVESFFSYININLNVPSDSDMTRRNKVKYLLNVKNDLSNRFLGEVLGCHHNTIKSDKEKIENEVNLNG